MYLVIFGFAIIKIVEILWKLRVDDSVTYNIVLMIT